ncbi:mediator of RNA polymerase II transcription subunit 1-domain-containing protein [Stachybotrys elegans]|uniref:Mediator of RNA polymerase II transcription subunit 1 n=1 Tax=Stachybotrys elegans TaxID=80388 RepID=A0A8K0T1E1_9HYPO|nr:mediator of RNA polymerase II transcription subunit 1-domain-containing protein [Stachybotrys elegans]
MGTPMRHAPSQQGRTPSQFAAATPPVSTPFSNPAHTAFSPRGSRSSPQHVKKSPATSQLLGQPHNGPLNFDSPSTAAAMGALGIGGGFDIGLDNVGGLEGLNVGFSSEEDKVKRLDSILNLLNTKRGLVSEAGLERLAQRLGLELLSEENTGPDGRKTKTLVIAGSAIALDIALDNNIVQNITLAFHGSPPSVAKHADAASRILLSDLQLLPNQSPLTKTLNKFALNFERLATLDKLSISPGLDCHEALVGVYDSLERLYQWDLGKLREDPTMAGKSDECLNSMAMCLRHGRPAMHARGRVGLALQYWRENPWAPLRAADVTPAMEERDNIWSLIISCAAIDGIGLPPVRVSDNWISKDIVKPEAPVDPKKPLLDWQEPENIALPMSEDNKNSGMDMLQPDLSTTRVPRVMFTVTFDPPVLLPQNDWMRLYECAQVEPPNLNALNDYTQRLPPTFDSLFFPIPPGTKVDPSEARTIVRRRRVRAFNDDQTPFYKTHENSLLFYKPIYSQEVREMPFSHPGQLIEMLPLLRQYALVAILLQNSFSPKTHDLLASKTDNGVPSKTGSLTTTDDVADLATTTPLESGEIKETDDSSPVDMRVDVTLWVHPLPHFQVTFPLQDTVAEITFTILEGGTVVVTSETFLGDSGTRPLRGQRGQLTRERLGKVLEHFQDICKTIEWVRLNLAGEK